MKAFIFDFDGTIADSFVTFLEIFEEIMERKQKLTEKEVENLRGRQLKYVLKYLKIKKWQIPRLAIKARKAVGIRIAEIKPFDGMPKAIKDLDSQGFEMFILSSNSPENITEFLKANSIENCFKNIYGNIGLRGKSSALKKVLRSERLKKDRCIYIGDELRDIEAAKKVGLEIASVSWGFSSPKVLKDAQPTVLITKPSELAKILESL